MYHDRPLIDMDEEEGRFEKICKGLFDKKRNDLIATCVLLGFAFGAVSMYFFLN